MHYIITWLDRPLRYRLCMNFVNRVGTRGKLPPISIAVGAIAENDNTFHYAHRLDPVVIEHTPGSCYGRKLIPPCPCTR